MAAIDVGNGLIIAAQGTLLLALAGLGLAVMIGRMGVVNLAHGATMMCGALLVVLCRRADLPAWIGIALAPVAAGGIGWLVERCVARSQRQSVADVLLVTWAVAIILRQLADAFFGPFVQPGDESAPASPGWIAAHRGLYLIAVEAIAVAAVGFALWWTWCSSRGLMVRAALRDRLLAARSGIDVERLDRHAFTVGSACSAMAGALLAPVLSFDAGFGADWLVPGIARLAGWNFGGP